VELSEAGLKLVYSPRRSYQNQTWP